MTNLRIALLFSGQPRCVDGLAYAAFKTCLLDRYDVDVYAHFWDEAESKKTTGTVAANIERFTQLYSPKAIRVDPPLRGDEYPLQFIQRASAVPLEITRRGALFPLYFTRRRPTIPIGKDTVLTTTDTRACLLRNCVSMYTSMGRVYDLFKAEGGDYDWIIRTRTDCVLLRCPQLESLDRTRLYAPQWHGLQQDSVVNHTLLSPPSLAPTLFALREHLETLPGASDESFLFHHLQRAGVLPSVRTLPLSDFYPTLTRDGIQTDKPEPDLVATVVPPPYVCYQWTTAWTQTSA